MTKNKYGGIPDTERLTTGGFSASKEGWQERALGRVRSRQKTNYRNTSRKNGLYIFIDDEFKVLLDEAAHRRDISLNGYVRRATAAMIAHDLGVPFEGVCQHMAPPVTYQRKVGPGWNKVMRGDDGKGFGRWLIDKLK